MPHEMETFAARLASFDLVLHPNTRRSSSSKPAKLISWPHSRPSPAELAHAGFFYNPYETNPDNTTCFLCRRALDGWEEDDNPIVEHLKHSKDCGWAVMMDIQERSSNPAEIEDPTSERIAQARLATFLDSWPHEGKRGWVCQSEKMVEGGWYFCPNEESVDLATCPYCKLSLDGWEPKDDPFDEHYRRSSDCSFFVFAKPPKGKGSRSKKGRTSKASSRLSTQSSASEVLASDIEDQMDPPARAKSTKKASRSKSKNTKSKKDERVETGSQMDVDEEYAQPEVTKPKRSTRGKKRSSAEMDRDVMSTADGEGVEQPEPPAKKRATKSRTSQQARSSVSNETAIEIPDESAAATEDEDQKKSRGSTKKRASKSRKASGVSSASKTASKTRIPRDSELDAAIEAALETDEPHKIETEEAISEKAESKSSSKKSRSKKKTAKKDPEPSNQVAGHVAEDETYAKSNPDADQEMLDHDEVSAQRKIEPAETKSKRRSSKNTGNQSDVQEDPTTRAQSKSQEVEDEDEPQHHESFVSVIVSKPPARNFEVEQTDKDGKKESKKKPSSEKTKKSKKAEKKVEQPRAEATDTREEQSPDMPEPSKPEQTPEQPARRRSSRVPPKTAERYSDIPQEKQYAKSVAESREPVLDKSSEDTRYPEGAAHEHEPISPLPSASRGTPSLSPQSSDAENHPPSLKPSVHQTQALSPSKNASVRFPLAASTPSPSKRNASAGRLQTSHPWVPIDIEEILLAGASDKENVVLHGTLSNLKGELTSPEKKMTMEEWIIWNAKNGEEKLKRECERLVGQFEREGARAMRALEGIECID